MYEDTAAAHARILDETNLMTTGSPRPSGCSGRHRGTGPIQSSSSTPCPMPAPSWCAPMLRTRPWPPSTMPAPSVRYNATTRVAALFEATVPACGYRVYDLVGAPASAERRVSVSDRVWRTSTCVWPSTTGEPGLGGGQGCGTARCWPPGASWQPLRPSRRLSQLLRRLGHRPVHPGGRRLPGRGRLDRGRRRRTAAGRHPGRPSFRKLHRFPDRPPRRRSAAS